MRLIKQKTSVFFINSNTTNIIEEKRVESSSITIIIVVRISTHLATTITLIYTLIAIVHILTVVMICITVCSEILLIQMLHFHYMKYKVEVTLFLTSIILLNF